VAARPSDQVDRLVADGAADGAGPRPGSIRHPLNPNAYYVDNGDGTVHVTMGTRWGRFAPNGRYVEGTLFEADPELCVWVAAPRPSSHHRISRVLDMPSER
jgi:hypothetical protein